MDNNIENINKYINTEFTNNYINLYYTIHKYNIFFNELIISIKKHVNKINDENKNLKITINCADIINHDEFINKLIYDTEQYNIYTCIKSLIEKFNLHHKKVIRISNIKPINELEKINIYYYINLIIKKNDHKYSSNIKINLPFYQNAFFNYKSYMLKVEINKKKKTFYSKKTFIMYLYNYCNKINNIDINDNNDILYNYDDDDDYYGDDEDYDDDNKKNKKRNN